jgi:hypothetical protein
MFVDSLDIANRACQHVGVRRIASPTEDSQQNNEIAFCYDKVRQAELRRNVWRFSIKYAMLRAIDSNTFVLDPAAWDGQVTYPVGSIVKDGNGERWVSVTAENLNNDPADGVGWDRYFGPMTVHLWDIDTDYSIGELVYKTAGNPGGYVIYMSLQDSNDDTPSTAEAWASTTTYNRGDVVSYGGYQWRSLIELNLNVTPAVAPLEWVPNNTYSSGQTVLGTDGYIYTAAASNNTNHDPVGDSGAWWTNSGNPAAWARVPEVYASANSWLPIYAGMSRIQLLSPAPANGMSRYRLPSGYLYEAPDNKEGSYAVLGASSHRSYSDKRFEGDFFVTGDAGPILFRFAADITDARKMDPLFCEGLACRVAAEVCEPLTQSNAKMQTIASAYKHFMHDARIRNAIEIGAREIDEDEFISCRA